MFQTIKRKKKEARKREKYIEEGEKLLGGWETTHPYI